MNGNATYMKMKKDLSCGSGGGGGGCGGINLDTFVKSMKDVEVSNGGEYE